jgi:hypothetical protein
VDDHTPDLAETVARLERQNSELRTRIYDLVDTIQLKEMGVFGRCAVRDCEGSWKMTRVPLCNVHLRHAAWDYQEKIIDPLKYGDEGRPPDPPAPKSSPAVYYIRMDRRIKIGTTTNLKLRMSAFHAQPDQLLAIEPGDQTHEHKRHKQFAHLRLGRTELFEIAPDLTDHVATVRGMFGDPLVFLT